MVARNLENLFSVEEVRNAIICMGKDKSADPDEFSMLFYQECWDIIQEDIMMVFAESYDIGIICKDINAIFLVLLPKKNKANELSDFYPISFVGNLYKIIANVLSIRSRGVIESIVLNAQSAFVKARQILDGILITNKCVDRRKKAKAPELVCKIDFEKAYDKVDWNFLI